MKTVIIVGVVGVAGFAIYQWWRKGKRTMPVSSGDRPQQIADFNRTRNSGTLGVSAISTQGRMAATVESIGTGLPWEVK